MLEDATWAGQGPELYQVRRRVFVEEQGVPESLEQDEHDTSCWHVLARDREGHPIGTGRLLQDGHLGRLAVLTTWRGRGVGKALMNRLLELARQQGLQEIVLKAQLQALAFYTKLGFQVAGESFLEAGIPHRSMRLRLVEPAAEEPPLSGTITLLNGLQDTHQALLALLAATRRSVHLYTPYLDPRLYNDPRIVDTISTQISQRPRLRGYLLLPTATVWRGSCPRLLQLAERLTSALSLRTLPDDEPHERPEFLQGFVIADQIVLLHQADPSNFIGSFAAQGTGKARELLNFFMQMWEKSAPDPELRRLHL